MKPNNNTLIIGISGIRGIVGEGLTPELACRFAAAFGVFSNRQKIVVGRDSRTSGKMLQLAVTAGLLSAGCKVIDAGIVPTPTLIFAVKSKSLWGGVAITASHNPLSWNGLKFIGSQAMFLNGEEGQRLLEIADSDAIERVREDSLGEVTQLKGIIEEHIQKVLSLELIDVDLIRKNKFKVVLDCCNGAGSVTSPVLLKALGCEVIEFACEPTGIFPHQPEPVNDNLQQLCEIVQKEKADVGFANDPDADRLAIVSEKGEAIGEEYTVTFASKLVLSKRKGPVVVNLSTSQMIDDVAREYNAKVIRTPVGEINVAEKMKEVNAPIGGEGNGGAILPELHYGRDALLGMALMLQLMTEEKKTVSQLVAALPRYTIVKSKFKKKGLDKEKALKKIKETYAREQLDLSNGIKIMRAQGWIHIRKSNTEPLIRIVAEASDEAVAHRMCKEVIGVLTRRDYVNEK